MATDIQDTTHAVEAAAVMSLLPARPQLLAAFDTAMCF